VTTASVGLTMNVPTRYTTWHTVGAGMTEAATTVGVMMVGAVTNGAATTTTAIGTKF
jgi:hypothetical protein